MTIRRKEKTKGREKVGEKEEKKAGGGEEEKKKMVKYP